MKSNKQLAAVSGFTVASLAIYLFERWIEICARRSVLRAFGGDERPCLVTDFADFRRELLAARKPGGRPTTYLVAR